MFSIFKISYSIKPAGAFTTTTSCNFLPNKALPTGDVIEILPC
jgi:hypothetical protein